MTLVIYRLLKSGGFSTGGFNFDSKVRRQSINLDDMFYGHIGGIDVLAKGLIKASEMISHGDICHMTKARYAKWDSGIGKEILQDKHTLDSLSKYAASIPSPSPVSGQQERFENIVTNVIYK
jgi:xylose isomerase